MNDVRAKKMENLKSGEELFFVTGSRISSPKWYRNPMLNKEETNELFLSLMNDTDIKDVNVYSENDLNKLTKTFDEEKSEWVDSWVTKRESIFGPRYQDGYESYCEEAGVNLDLVKKWKTIREKKGKEIEEKLGKVA